MEQLGIGTPKPTPNPVPTEFDSRSEKNLATLAPNAQRKAREWLRMCQEAGIYVKIICGTRSYEEQAALYAKGRTEPGKKVTNARPGYSWHNFGVAWDFVVFDEQGQPQWDSPLMDRCGKIGKEIGLEWGGTWKRFVDKAHLQLDMAITLAEARQRVKDGKTVA
ncbi:MAG: M15 family metallopeptidase [Akkermansiaceae bacterium]|nr:M15 family metallopeptidase [Akkermansiaceae bacterium]